MTDYMTENQNLNIINNVAIDFFYRFLDFLNLSTGDISKDEKNFFFGELFPNFFMLFSFSTTYCAHVRDI